jgi:hypothetical protein
MPDKNNLPKGIALKFTFWYLFTQQSKRLLIVILKMPGPATTAGLF